jgi:hypothetical protein
MGKSFRLKLRGKTGVFIDWANVYRWRDHLGGYEVDPKMLHKYLKVYYDEANKKWIERRKCDFDLEIGLDAFEAMEEYQSFVFFSGDGDYATLYKRLIERRKQVIVVYAHGSLGREVWKMTKGIYKVSVERFEGILKKCPPAKGRGRD